MFDFSIGELAMIGAVALIVLGPERLPKVARTVGEWAGKAQRYVSQVKADINREIELSELKKLQEQARDAVRSFETSVQDNVSSLKSGIEATASELKTGFEDPASAQTAPKDEYSWENVDPWTKTRFSRRYRPGPSVDELAEEITKVKRQLALPETTGHPRHKYAPRARLNRPRIRR
jgi:sec-independent protein translocase protein TatB